MAGAKRMDSRFRGNDNPKVDEKTMVVVLAAGN